MYCFLAKTRFICNINKLCLMVTVTIVVFDRKCSSVQFKYLAPYYVKIPTSQQSNIVRRRCLCMMITVNLGYHMKQLFTSSVYLEVAWNSKIMIKLIYINKTLYCISKICRPGGDLVHNINELKWVLSIFLFQKTLSLDIFLI